MVGHPKHVSKALEVGVDLICAQAGEGGGHTGDMPASILIPAVVDEVEGKKSPLTGGPVLVIGAGAVYDGRGLAANLAWGAQAVWVGTRFVACEEAGAPPLHKKAIVGAGHEDFARTLIYTGRPLRVVRSPYVDDWYVADTPILEITDSLFEGIDPFSSGRITVRPKPKLSSNRVSFPTKRTSRNTPRNLSVPGHGSLVALLLKYTRFSPQRRSSMIWSMTLLGS